MALPTSINTKYGRTPRTVLAADLLAIQDEIIGLFSGDHGSRYRFVGPYNWFPDTGGSPALNAGQLHWLLTGASSEIYARIPTQQNSGVDGLWFVCNPLSATGLVVGYQEDNITTGSTVTTTTATSSSTGWQLLEVSISSFVSSTDMAYLAAKNNGGSGGEVFGALIRWDQP
jgi:hypothetical protein